MLPLDTSAPVWRVTPTGEKVIVVAGGAGFLGAALCERLLDKGHTVICIDNLLSSDTTNIAPFFSDPKFRFLRKDIITGPTIPGPVDEIYNLACPASPPRYQRDPIHTMRTSFDGSIALLDLAVEKNARILLASTSETYGDPELSPQPESYRGNVNTVGPRACYDEGKRIAETLFWEYRDKNGVDTRIARIFNTYGPGMAHDDGRVVSNFVVQALQDRPLTIYGDGSQTRSFCYVDDLVEGLMRLMASDEPMPVNLGNPEEFTILELVEKVGATLGRDLDVTFRPLPGDDPRQRRPDISRAKEILAWQPRVKLADGLEPTVSWFARRLEIISEREGIRVS